MQGNQSAENSFPEADYLPEHDYQVPASLPGRDYLVSNRLAGRDYLRMLDLTPEDLFLLLDTAAIEKARWQADPDTAQSQAPYRGRAVGIILEKPSLRTRVSFERAVSRLGAQPIVMSDTSSAFSRGESLKDTMMVMDRYVDAIVIRSFAQSRVEELAFWAEVPVVNALTDDFHPCQGLADFMTIRECFGKLSGLKLAYLGDGSNNMAHTYLEGGALLGMQVAIAAPVDYQPKPQYLAEASAMAKQTGAELLVTDSPEEALAGADVVITDAWASMGFEAEHTQRMAALAPYQVTAASFAQASDQAIFLHCLPAHRGEEVTDEVMDADYSRIYVEAENRMHAQQALLLLLMQAG
ncbi:MAG: ornithine carbamoyltransferase [Coriobacteriales bacterium]|jgi:ornithine carbamoyltransferase|nr:ornithine carbamoyltransferase [Coriobacteriales bacterium]